MTVTCRSSKGGALSADIACLPSKNKSTEVTIRIMEIPLLHPADNVLNNSQQDVFRQMLDFRLRLISVHSRAAAIRPSPLRAELQSINGAAHRSGRTCTRTGRPYQIKPGKKKCFRSHLTDESASNKTKY